METKEELELNFVDYDKPKRCLKFTGYIYLPKEKPTLIGIKRLINYPREGRVEIFNEFNKKKGSKMMTFGNFQELSDELETEFRKRAKKIMKEWKEK